METLKRLLIVSVLSGIWMVPVEAQVPGPRQTTFYKSYDLEKAGNHSAAIAELKKVYKADDYFVNIRLGWLYYLAKNYTESLKYYQQAIRLKPGSIEARFGCVKPLSAMENWDGCKDQYLAVLRLDPNNTRASYWLGVIYYNRKNYTQSDKLFSKVVNLYPLDYDSVIMLAWTKYRLGKSQEAKAWFNHALTLMPNDKDALSGLKLLQ